MKLVLGRSRRTRRRRRKQGTQHFLYMILLIGTFYVGFSVGTAILLSFYSFSILSRVLYIRFSFFFDFSKNRHPGILILVHRKTMSKRLWDTYLEAVLEILPWIYCVGDRDHEGDEESKERKESPREGSRVGGFRQAYSAWER